MTIHVLGREVHFSDCVEELVQIQDSCLPTSLFSLVSPFNLGIISEQNYGVFYFRSPFTERFFFPRGINRELLQSKIALIDKIFLLYLSLWIVLAYASIIDLYLRSTLFIRSSFSLKLFCCKSEYVLEHTLIRMCPPFIKQIFKYFCIDQKQL